MVIQPTVHLLGDHVFYSTSSSLDGPWNPYQIVFAPTGNPGLYLKLIIQTRRF